MFEQLIDEKFLNANDKIAVGVSGGADSMLLLWALLEKQKKLGFYLKVIHVNHMLRGEASEKDSLFVENFCKKRKIEYEIAKIDVKKLKNDGKYTLEESARLARFDAFNKIMKKEKLNKLFLAHHKNDQAETILMHIFRGSGIAGACGIKNTETIFRPLLNLSKKEILALAKDHGIEFVQDASNNENDYTRNYIRNVIFPQLEEVYPSVVNNIVSFGKRCEEIQKYILSLVDESKLVMNGDEILINQEVFGLEKFIVREYLKRAFEKLNVFSDIEAKHFSLIFELSKAEVNKEISLPHNLIARKVYAGVKIFKLKTKETKELCFEFMKNGEIIFGEHFKIITKVVKSSDVVYGEGLYVDANKVSTNAVWRTRKPGDKFAKLGTGSKKLNDYFTNSKVEFDLRDKIPILASGESVLVILGDDVSENVKIDGETDEIVKITFERLN